MTPTIAIVVWIGVVVLIIGFAGNYTPRVRNTNPAASQSKTRIVDLLRDLAVLCIAAALLFIVATICLLVYKAIRFAWS